MKNKELTAIVDGLNERHQKLHKQLLIDKNAGKPAHVMDKIVESADPAPVRLERWLRTLCTAKQKKVTEDPEMFATYLTLAREACSAVRGHREHLMDQVAGILSDGVKEGAFEVADTKASARAIFDATVRYHNPAHAEEWKDPELGARFDALLALLLRGLAAPCQR